MFYLDFTQFAWPTANMNQVFYRFSTLFFAKYSMLFKFCCAFSSSSDEKVRLQRGRRRWRVEFVLDWLLGHFGPRHGHEEVSGKSSSESRNAGLELAAALTTVVCWRKSTTFLAWVKSAEKICWRATSIECWNSFPKTTTAFLAPGVFLQSESQQLSAHCYNKRYT